MVVGNRKIFKFSSYRFKSKARNDKKHKRGRIINIIRPYGYEVAYRVDGNNILAGNSGYSVAFRIDY